MKKYLIPSIIAFVLAIFVGFFAYRPQTTDASVSIGSSYVYATFAPAQTNTNYKQSIVLDSIQPATTSVPRYNGGTLGSVIITGTSTGNLVLYDATTSNVTLRAGATTTLPILAQFPANAVGGTYTFDEYYQLGLVVEFNGAQGTSTITYRPY